MEAINVEQMFGIYEFYSRSKSESLIVWGIWRRRSVLEKESEPPEQP